MSQTAPRRGLGRGLSALLGEAAQPAGEGEASKDPPKGDIREAPIELLRRNPQQPRRIFSDAEIDELAESIRQRGVLQPLLVRPAPEAAGEYQIVAGERRWRASQRAGLRVLPIVVRTDLDDLDVLEIGVIENVQRQDLKPLEEAEAYKTLIERFGRTQEEVARTVGKSRSHVANILRLLALPSGVQAALNEGRLTSGHARAIAGASDPERLARIIVERDLSVREAEALARSAQPREGRLPRLETKSVPKDADTAALEQDLSERLGLKVQIFDHDGQGEVRIAYRSLEQLDGLCARLSG